MNAPQAIVCVGTVAFKSAEVVDIRARWLRMESVASIAARYHVSTYAIRELAKRGWR